MSQPPLGFAEQYGRALDDYLAQPTAQMLERAHELGVLAIAKEVSMGELASLHAELIDQRATSAPAGSALFRRAAAFLAGAASAFDRELRELRRENTAMRASSRQLDQMVTQ